MAPNQTTAVFPPPFEKMDWKDSGYPVYFWEITTDETNRLGTMLGNDFASLGMTGTYVTAPPMPCTTCGKWTEFIDWVYTALQREVHSPTFIFNALKNRERPEENRHDVYCSGCGTLTHIQAGSTREGPAGNVQVAGPLRRTGENKYNEQKTEADESSKQAQSKKSATSSTLWIPSNPWFAFGQAAEKTNMRGTYWIPSNPWTAFNGKLTGVESTRETLWIPSKPWWDYKRKVQNFFKREEEPIIENAISTGHLVSAIA
ncbi:hypothetical protein K474DRAFT_1709097 [Panus rudis PR-1116 ss-1]|nr:hypothetical protein K474DRAFT_1709097 [Panus rudis PR-1116 ss-1]